jgi:hypothetical protein
MIQPMKQLVLTSLSSLFVVAIHAAETPAAEAPARWSRDKAN